MNTHIFQHHYEQPMPAHHPSVSALVPADQVSNLISELRQPQEYEEFEKVMNNFNEYFLERFTARNPVPKGQFPFGSVAQPTTVYKPLIEHPGFIPPYRPVPEYTPSYYPYPPRPVSYSPHHNAQIPQYSNYVPHPPSQTTHFSGHGYEYRAPHYETGLGFRPQSSMQRSSSQTRLRTADPWNFRHDRNFGQSFARKSPERNRYEYSPQPQAWGEEHRGRTPVGSFKEMRQDLESRMRRY